VLAARIGFAQGVPAARIGFAEGVLAAPSFTREAS
jgi:hypothetical protein